MTIPSVSLSVAEALLRSSAAGAEQKRQERPHFTITISREVGALGKAVADEVGRRLDCPVYDRELVDKIAEELRRPTFHLSHLDERPVGWLEESLGDLLTEYRVSPDVYLKYLIGTVRGLGAVGRCVIVGRGANFILPAETTLRVRLVADLPDRIRVIRERKNCTEKEAEEYIAKTDLERAGFSKRYFNVDPTDPHHYDLLLNTSRLTVSECADVIVSLYARLESRTRQPRPNA